LGSLSEASGAVAAAKKPAFRCRVVRKVELCSKTIEKRTNFRYKRKKVRAPQGKRRNTQKSFFRRSKNTMKLVSLRRSGTISSSDNKQNTGRRPTKTFSFRSLKGAQQQKNGSKSKRDDRAFRLTGVVEIALWQC
jgi:hypothetical protein